MKKTKLSVVLSAVVFAVTTSAFAAPKKKLTKESEINASSSTRTTWSASAAEGSSSHEMGFGVADAGNLIGGNISPSFLFGIGEKSSIQAVLGVPSTVGSFNFGVGGVFRHTCMGDKKLGLHLGGALGLGITGAKAFFVNIAGVAGIHFQVANSIGVNLDVGPGVSVGDVATNFSLQGIGSNTLAASVHYLW